MLEIICLFAFCKKMASMANDRNRSPVPWVGLLVVVWFFGELCGVVIASVAYLLNNPNADDPNPPLAWSMGAAIVGGLCAAGAVLKIMSHVPVVADTTTSPD